MSAVARSLSAGSLLTRGLGFRVLTMISSENRNTIRSPMYVGYAILLKPEWDIPHLLQKLCSSRS